MSEKLFKNTPVYIRAIKEAEKAIKRLNLKEDEARGVKLAVDEMFKRESIV